MVTLFAVLVESFGSVSTNTGTGLPNTETNPTPSPPGYLTAAGIRTALAGTRTAAGFTPWTAGPSTLNFASVPPRATVGDATDSSGNLPTRTRYRYRAPPSNLRSHNAPPSSTSAW